MFVSSDLLFWFSQLQGNFLIRRVQADVAKEMMSPRSDKNTVMQVHMGEGKSSVIIPICAAALADGNQLVRVIAPKALIHQTLEILTARLSGLVGMPIYHFTFSRSGANAEVVEKTYRDLCGLIDDRGIVVTQPEHVLSLKLACVEKTMSRKQGFKYVPRVPKGSQLKSVSKATMVMI